MKIAFYSLVTATSLAAAQSASAVISYVDNAILFELRAKNGGNQGAAELFTIDNRDHTLRFDSVLDDTNVLVQSAATLGTLNGGPNTYGLGWSTGPEPAGTRSHINGGTAGANSTDNIIANYTFQIFDADGVFTFTENIDDRVHMTVNGINYHNDGGWNSQTYGVWNDNDGQGGGWYDVVLHLVEDGGGAGQVGSLGLGFYNGNSTTLGDFSAINAAAWTGDVDPASGVGIRAVLDVPEPSRIVFAMIGLGAVLARRRR